MFEGFELFRAIDITGALGVLFIVMILMVTGRLVPKKFYDEARADRDKWMIAWKQIEDATSKHEDTLKALVSISKDTNYLVESLLPPLRKEKSDGPI